MQQIMEALENSELREAFAKEQLQNNLEDRMLEAQRILEARQASIPTFTKIIRNHVLTNAIRKSLVR